MFQISEKFYARHDGTRSYFFGKEEFTKIAETAGFNVEAIEVCERSTTNVKEELNVKRLFLQATLIKQ
jgi:methyltransferase-like protein 6